MLYRLLVIGGDTDFKLLDTTSVQMFFFTMRGSGSSVELASLIAIVLGMVFGAIHCAGWNLQSPSVVEGHMWRIASVVIVVCPLSIALMPVIAPVITAVAVMWILCGPPTNHVASTVALFSFFCSMYVMARLFTLLEAFLALCDLPVSATYAVQWTTILPHV